MRYKTECPRCGKTGVVNIDPTKATHVRCGDCLMNDVEVVTLILASEVAVKAYIAEIGKRDADEGIE